MKEFKPGDRVIVRRGGRADFRGRVSAVNGPNSVQVIEDGCYSVHEDCPFHPSQLVRLKPKAKLVKKEARRAWMHPNAVSQTRVCEDGWLVFPFMPTALNVVSGHEFIEFREVLPGEVVVTEGGLKNVWHIVMKNYVGVNRPGESRAFDDFLIALKAQGDGNHV